MAPLAPVAPVAGTTTGVVTPAPQKKSRTGLYIGLGVGGCVLLLLIIWFWRARRHSINTGQSFGAGLGASLGSGVAGLLSMGYS